MLDNLDIDHLVKLAEDNDVKVDRRWKRERIVDTLRKAGVKDPAEKRTPKDEDKLSHKVDQEPVRFVGAVGGIRVVDGEYETDGGAGRVLKPGLYVHFCDATGEPVGGYSRNFYPDKPDCDESLDCDCAKCLAAVRDYIKHHKHGKKVAEQHKISEVSVNDPVLNIGGWDRISGDDVADLHAKLDFDVHEAMRFEKRYYKRKDVIDALDDLGSKGDDEPEDGDILTAEVEA